MIEYIRPQVHVPVFTDASGEVIAFGSRWDQFDGSPPEESYSVDEHPERFAPLHRIADALTEHLTASYDVRVEEGKHLIPSHRYSADDDWVLRAVRISPRAAGCAPLTLVYSSYPGVSVWAGCNFFSSFPSCGCNACDETWETAADEMEHQVLTVVAGGLTERVGTWRFPRWRYNRGFGLSRGMSRIVMYELVAPDGSRSESAELNAGDLTKPQLSSMRSTLLELAKNSPAGNWLPWPKRKPLSATS